MTDRIWYLLGWATCPRWVFRGPHWWRRLNVRWLEWWGWVFMYSDPWKPGSITSDPKRRVL